MRDTYNKMTLSRKITLHKISSIKLWSNQTSTPPFILCSYCSIFIYLFVCLFVCFDSIGYSILEILNVGTKLTSKEKSVFTCFDLNLSEGLELEITSVNKKNE